MPPPLRQRYRYGFVLLTILWIFVGIGILAFAAAFASRSSVASAHNRSALAQAQWLSHGCIERARAAAHATMISVSPDYVAAIWDSLDRVILHSPFLSGTTCDVQMRAVGAPLNINSATEGQFRKFFVALNIAPARIDSLVAALLDWRDSDTLPRPLGAEREWYVAARRVVPRDGPFASQHELLSIRGFEQFGDTLSLLGTDSARIPLFHAPAAVLSSLPGMSPEVVARASAFRMRNERIPELLSLSTNLPESARDTLMAHYAELAWKTTVEPEGWVISATAHAGTPEVRFTTKVRVARAGTRIAIMERR